MSIEEIKLKLLPFTEKYSITKLILFGSRADYSNTEDSDVDLIVEFSKPISLITLSQIKIEMEEVLKLDVDIVHGPIRDGDMIQIGKEVILYAA